MVELGVKNGVIINTADIYGRIHEDGDAAYGIGDKTYG
jgi:hypothetical protein